MILIQRYIFKELLYNFVFSFVVITLIILLATSVKVIFKYKVLGILMLLKSIPLMLVASLIIIIPAAVMVATVMTYGRVSSDNEIVAMRASGIHVLRTIVPGILFGFVCSFGMLVINDLLVPHAEQRLKNMLTEVDISNLLDTALRRGEKKLEHSDWVLTWDACEKVKEEDPGEDSKDQLARWRFTGFRVRQYDKDDNLKINGLAESATVVPDESGSKLFLNLYHVTMLGEREVTTDKMIIPMSFEKKRRSKVRLSMRRLSAVAAILEREEPDKVYPDHKVKTELHKRIADSFRPLILVLLSLPVAIIFRQQNRMVAFLIAILLVFFIYYPVTLLGESFSNKQVFPPFLSIWTGNGALAMVGLVLILKVMRR